MSVFSGKCDLYDSFVMISSNGDESKIQNNIDRTRFYIYSGDKTHRLDIHTLKDLVPYYPYIVAFSYGCKEVEQTIVLSSESWVDREEKEHIGWILEDAKKEYRKCKRKKITFNPDDWINKSHWTNAEVKKEIVKRVVENGEKANINGIHLSSYDKWDRKRLAQEMSRVGYSDYEINHWVYQGRNYNWKNEED